MKDLILHQYPGSPFSEKVRALMGYKGIQYQSVETTVIMPRPDLMPMTGGYRRIPVLQHGADIYCDSAAICKLLDGLYPDNTLYPAAKRAVIEGFAQWADSLLFRVCVTVAFQPSALASEPLFKDEAARQAFFEDRAELTKGSMQIGMPFETAEPYLIAQLHKLDNQLQAGDSFLFGGAPTIADFSVYHMLWFVYKRKTLKHYFNHLDHLQSWYGRMAGFGHGKVSTISSADALEIARSSEPGKIAPNGNFSTAKIGTEVEVRATDYGRQPVKGVLLKHAADEIVLARSDDRAGQLAVHFPNLGYEIIG